MKDTQQTISKLQKEVAELKTRLNKYEPIDGEGDGGGEGGAVGDLPHDTEEIYRGLFENAGDAIFILNAEGEETGQIIAANHAATEMYGYEQDKLRSMSITDLYTAETAQAAIERTKDILKGERISTEVNHKRKDGTEFKVEVSAALLEIGSSRYILEFDRDITARKKMEDELVTISITDELTGLLNRRGFVDIASKQLKIACRYTKDVVLFFLDMDGLKIINDTLGHGTGDIALKDVADILRKTFRETDIISRFGGDEFVVMMPETSQQTFTTVLKRLQENIKDNKLKGRDFDLSVSVGIAFYDDELPCTIDELITRADDSMYKQKITRDTHRK